MDEENIFELNFELFQLLNSRLERDVFGPEGLSHNEIKEIESLLGFDVPPDFYFYLSHLQNPLNRFFDWKNFQLSEYERMIQGVMAGIKFDIEHNSLWLKRWGKKPIDLEEAMQVFENDFYSWPKLLPIYGHRFLVTDPVEVGNPVFSIWQTDIIYYGIDLANYLIHEFARDLFDNQPTPPVKRIPIWSDFVEFTDGFFETDKK